MSGNMRNMRDSFLHFLADNLPSGIIHPIRFQKNAPQFNSMQIGKLNVAFHDGIYSVKTTASQFVTIDILDDDELDAIDIEEQTIELLQQAGYTPLLDYSSDSANPAQVGNSLIYWDVQGIKFRTVTSIDYFHRAAVLTLYARYASYSAPAVKADGLAGIVISDGIGGMDYSLTVANGQVVVTALSTYGGYSYAGLIDTVTGTKLSIHVSNGTATLSDADANVVADNAISFIDTVTGSTCILTASSGQLVVYPA